MSAIKELGPIDTFEASDGKPQGGSRTIVSRRKFMLSSGTVLAGAALRAVIPANLARAEGPKPPVKPTVAPKNTVTKEQLGNSADKKINQQGSQWESRLANQGGEMILSVEQKKSLAAQWRVVYGDKKDGALIKTLVDMQITSGEWADHSKAEHPGLDLFTISDGKNGKIALMGLSVTSEQDRSNTKVYFPGLNIDNKTKAVAVNPIWNGDPSSMVVVDANPTKYQLNLEKDSQGIVTLVRTDVSNAKQPVREVLKVDESSIKFVREEKDSSSRVELTDVLTTKATPFLSQKAHLKSSRLSYSLGEHPALLVDKGGIVPAFTEQKSVEPGDDVWTSLPQPERELILVLVDKGVDPSQSLFLTGTEGLSHVFVGNKGKVMGVNPKGELIDLPSGSDPKELAKAIGIPIGMNLPDKLLDKPMLLEPALTAMASFSPFMTLGGGNDMQSYGTDGKWHDDWIMGMMNRAPWTPKTAIWHTLVSPDTVPANKWQKGQFFSGSAENDVIAHVKHVVGKFGSNFQYFTINEPRLNFAPELSERDPLRDKLGADYIDTVIKAAFDANPKAIIVLNDTQNHMMGSGPLNSRHYEQTLRLVQKYKDRGIVLGIEGHLTESAGFDTENALRTLSSYGIPFFLTEIDAVGSDKFRADATRGLLAAAYATNKCLGAIFWEPANANFQWRAKEGKAGLFDYNSQTNIGKGPMYNLGLMKALDARYRATH